MTSSVPSEGRGGSVGPVTILHLDMDAFFASVEVRDNPALEGLPVVVGGTGERAVVASASYEARRYGIASAMAMAEARRLCPCLVVVAGRHDRYGEVSRQLMVLLEKVTPVVEPVALDEAYLDLSGVLRRGASAATVAGELRAAVYEALQLPCAVGVARTKLLAKLASKAAKPRPGTESRERSGVVVVDPADEEAFLGAHPIRALPGVGPRTADKLRRYGVETVRDLTLVDVGSLVRLLGRSHGTTLHDLAHGRDPRPVEPTREVASIGHEETFARDERSADRLASLAGEMAQTVAARCRQAGRAPRRIAVKVRFADFTTISRSRTLDAPATTGLEIGRVAAQLLADVAVGRGVRLLGVHGSALVPLDVASVPARQLALFAALDVPGGELPGDGTASDDRYRRQEGVETAADEIRRRYGDHAIASLGFIARRRGDG